VVRQPERRLSQPKTLTVTNNTKYAFLFSGVSAEIGFSVASTTCGVLQPGQSCTVQIVFVPMHPGYYVSRLSLATPYSPTERERQTGGCRELASLTAVAARPAVRELRMLLLLGRDRVSALQNTEVSARPPSVTRLW